MDASFWHTLWTDGRIAFHEGQANLLLAEHLAGLGLAAGARVFVPLCGKTRDIAWLLEQGFEVVGVELSKLAVEQLFAEMDVVPDVRDVDGMHLFEAPGVRVFVGDIFALMPAQVGQMDLVYDRAALVAMPEEMREAYAAQVIELAQGRQQLVITFTYAQDQMAGPPFSIPEAALEDYFDGTYRRRLLDAVDVRGGLKGKVAATEKIWHLLPKASRK